MFTTIVIRVLLVISLFGSGLLFSSPSNQRALENLMLAIEDNRSADFQRSLEKIADINQEVNGKAPLLRASKLGRVPMVQALLQHNADTEYRLEDGYTALMKASYAGHVDIVNLLIQHNADIDYEHANGFAAFDWALEGKHSGVMLVLIEAIARKNFPAAQYDLFKQLTAATNNLNGILDKDKRDNNTNVAEEIQSLALLWTAIANRPEQTKLLLQAGFDPDSHNSTGYSVLPMTIRLNQKEQAELLLRFGANINIGNNGNDEASPLNQAARATNHHLLNWLLQKGANANKPNARGYSALHISAMRQCLTCVETLLQHGAKLLNKAEKGFTPFDFAYQTGNRKIIELMLNRYSSQESTSIAEASLAKKIVLLLNHSDSDQIVGFSPTELNTSVLGYFPLNYATYFSTKHQVKSMVDLGANFNKPALSGYGTTPLMDAVRHQGNEAVFHWLVRQPIDLRQPDKFGDPVINWTTYYGHERWISLLLSLGADPLQENEEGFTAVKTAEQRGFKTISASMQSHLEQRKIIDQLITQVNNGTLTADDLKLAPNLVDVHSSSGTTLLLEAITKNNYDIFEQLLQLEANVNLASATGYLATPLMLAAYNKQATMVDRLIAGGARLNQRDRMGDTALNWVVYAGHDSMVSRLLKAGADTTITSIHGDALAIALRRGHYSIAEAIADKQLDDKKSLAKQHQDSLFEAITDKDYRQLQTWRFEDSQLSLNNRFGEHLLNFAVVKQCYACVEALLKNKLSVNSENRIGFTPLMVAAREGHKAIAELLIKNGANVNHSANHLGMELNALTLAATHGHTELIELLLNNGANINHQDIMGNTAIMWALGESRIRVVKQLIKNEADLNLVNRFGFNVKPELSKQKLL